MLQSGGGNNTSAALLRQYFSYEQKCEEHTRKSAQKGSLRGNRTGILPVITGNTDVASLRRTPRKNGAPGSTQHSPRGTLPNGKTAYPLPYELPQQGIGYKVEDVSPPTTADATMRGPKNAPTHGKLPPYGRKAITKEFYDDVSGGGIACLYPVSQTGLPRSARVQSPRGTVL
jgi:hypothetical protein